MQLLILIFNCNFYCKNSCLQYIQYFPFSVTNIFRYMASNCKQQFAIDFWTFKWKLLSFWNYTICHLSTICYLIPFPIMGHILVKVTRPSIAFLNPSFQKWYTASFLHVSSAMFSYTFKHQSSAIGIKYLSTNYAFPFCQ